MNTLLPIKRLRLYLGMSMTEIAVKSGISRNAIVSWEQDSISPSSAILAKLTAEYGVSQKWLRTGEAENELDTLINEAKIETEIKPDVNEAYLWELYSRLTHDKQKALIATLCSLKAAI